MSESLNARFKCTYTAFALDVDLQLPLRGLTALFGHSGSGKTTILRGIAGLDRHAGAAVQFGSTHWQSGDTFVPPHRRAIGYVFQEPGLFAHLSVCENLTYASRRASASKSALSRAEIVAILDIEPLLSKRPAQLSGGERQRVAIARALLVRPSLLLMDEPLASLDAARKREILTCIERLKNELNVPIVYVTHSVDELVRLADHWVVLEQGRAVHAGAFIDSLNETAAVQRLGDDFGAAISGEVREVDRQWRLVRVEFVGGSLWVSDAGYREGQMLRLQLSARDVSLALDDYIHSSILNRLRGTVAEIADSDSPSALHVVVDVGGALIRASVTRRSADHLKLHVGQAVWVQIKSVAVVR